MFHAILPLHVRTKGFVSTWLTQDPFTGVGSRMVGPGCNLACSAWNEQTDPTSTSSEMGAYTTSMHADAKSWLISDSMGGCSARRETAA
jgi:hypothetical protein